MTILYLTEDYLHSKVHNNLLVHMLEQNEKLTIYVFTPIRQRIGETLDSSFVEHNRLIEVTAPIDISLKRYRFDFWAKIRCKVRLIEKHIPLRDIDVIHAATLFTEGCTARALQKKYGIPYLASMRGSDSDFYARSFLHLWPLSYRVIKYAGVLAYVTPNIKRRMLEKWQYRNLAQKLKNGYVINNGIDDIWLENLYIGTKCIGNPIRVIYIGRFDANKNVMRLIEAVKCLRNNCNIYLTIVGGDGEEQKLVEQEVSSNSSYMEYYGKIYDKRELMHIVRESDIFAMISHSETFGLVYAECLTQGLPLLYSSKTGFDGMYPQGEIGYAVDSHSVESISSGLKAIIDNYNLIRRNISSLDFSRYDWKNIAKRYVSLYGTMIKH